MRRNDEWRNGFGAGFSCGMLCMALLMLIAVSFAGCQDIEQAEPANRAEKVASIMAAEGITIGDVATFVQQYGYTVIPGNLKPWHWAPSQPGSAPIAYYVATIKVAVGDTSMTVWFQDRASTAYSISVVAYDDNGARSARSLLGWSNGTGAGALPGTEQP